MDGRPTWTDCDEAGDYVVPNVLSPRDLVFRPDNMDETVPHIEAQRPVWSKTSNRYELHHDKRINENKPCLKKNQRCSSRWLPIKI